LKKKKKKRKRGRERKRKQNDKKKECKPTVCSSRQPLIETPYELAMVV
jgi:hypothetical protein